MNILPALIKKEFTQIKRNKFLPKLMIGFPILIMLIIPWVTTLDVRHVDVVVVDADHSSFSARLIDHFVNSEFFAFQGTASSFAAAQQELEQGNVDVIVEIPANFEKSLVQGHPQKIAVSANAVNAIKANLGMQYVLQTTAGTLQEMRSEQGLSLPEASVVVQNRYNPTLNYRYYMIPALMIMVLILICGFLPALSIVGEKEKGTMEQINVTPVSPFVFTLSKLIPYWIIGLVILSIVMLIAFLVWSLPPTGNVGVIYLAAFFFILTISSLGISIANGSDNMQQTMFMMFFFLIIFILMSGLLTPITSMPTWAQWITRFLPPRYFVDIMRAVYLKGAGFTDMVFNLLPLAGFAILFSVLAGVTYKKQR